jgi:hypothetical protein
MEIEMATRKAKRFKFTDLSVAQKKWDPEHDPKHKFKQQLYWDTDRKGLALLIGSSSKQKSFRLYVKIGDKWRWVGLGKYGTRPGCLTLAAAKAKAGLIEADVFKGLDPRKRRKVRPDTVVLDPASGPTYIEVVGDFIKLTQSVPSADGRAAKPPSPTISRIGTIGPSRASHAPTRETSSKASSPNRRMERRLTARLGSRVSGVGLPNVT